MRKRPSRKVIFPIAKPASKNISWEELPDSGWFAVYDAPPNGYTSSVCLFITKGSDNLREKCRLLVSSGAIGEDSILWVQTAASEGDLIDPETERLVRDITQRIEILKARGERKALARVRAALERQGTKPGPKRPEYAAWKIYTLHGLADHLSFSEALKNGLAGANIVKDQDTAKQELWRYCREFYRSCLFRNLSPDNLQTCTAAQFIRERFGFEFPGDLKAASEAYKRGHGSPKE